VTTGRRENFPASPPSRRNGPEMPERIHRLVTICESYRSVGGAREEE
jgi:hypothetical protein